MRPAGGGTGFAVPPGDPDAVREGARALTRAAAAMAGASTRTTSTALAGATTWRGPASSSFVARATTTGAGMRALADGFGAAGRALDEYADALADAQQRARAAHADLVEATEQLRREAARAAGEAQRVVQVQAERALEAARAEAHRRARLAQEDLAQAARQAAHRLEGVADRLRAVSAKDLLEWLGGPDVAFGLLGLFAQGAGAKVLLDARRALSAHDLAALRRVDPTGWERVVEVAARHGDDSLEAVRAQLEWQRRVLPGVITQMSDASAPLGAVPVGRLAAALDLLGKAGVVTSVVSNTWTIVKPDDEDTLLLDRVAAGGNLVGLGMAASGSSATAALLGGAAATGWVPVAGQIVLAVTAGYMAVRWYQQNQELVHAFVDRMGDGLEAAEDWTEQQLRDCAAEVRRDLEEARDTVAVIADDAVEVAGEVVTEVGELASEARDRAVRAISAANPFD